MRGLDALASLFSPLRLDEVVKRVRAIDPRIDESRMGPLDVLYCYRLLLGRSPDPAGWEFWKAATAKGMPVAEAVGTFLSSGEGRARLTPAPRLVETRRGFSIFIDPQDPLIGKEIANERDYEPHVSAFLSRELRGATGTFVDVGSNIGWYLLLASSIAPRLRLVGFEPNPGNVELCLRSLQHRGLVEAVVYPFALTGARCFLGLAAVGSNGSVVNDLRSATVVMGVAGDEYLGGEERISLVKIDVEGHEPLALQGLARVVDRHRPVIVSELHPACLRQNCGVEPEQYLDQVRALGYAISVLARDQEGTELRCASNKEVMSQWRRQARTLEARGNAHVDIVARPLPRG